MDKLIVLGTGNASATRCYNTCFALSDGAEYFLADGGGGNGILRQTAEAGVPLSKIHHAFLSHSHTDHIFGMVWVLRIVATLMNRKQYDGTFCLYSHPELSSAIRTVADLTIVPDMTRHFDERILFIPVADGETRRILNYPTTFFDIHSTKEKQFGFSLRLNSGKKLSFLGDEPYNERCEPYVRGSDWLLSEAFCLDADKERFRPHEKHHGTVKEACELGERLGVKNLLLWHTEDSDLAGRKARYIEEGRRYYSGNLFVPDDLEVMEL